MPPVNTSSNIDARSAPAAPLDGLNKEVVPASSNAIPAKDTLMMSADLLKRKRNADGQCQQTDPDTTKGQIALLAASTALSAGGDGATLADGRVAQGEAKKSKRVPAAGLMYGGKGGGKGAASNAATTAATAVGEAAKVDDNSMTGKRALETADAAGPHERHVKNGKQARAPPLIDPWHMSCDDDTCSCHSRPALTDTTPRFSLSELQELAESGGPGSELATWHIAHREDRLPVAELTTTARLAVLKGEMGLRQFAGAVSALQALQAEKARQAEEDLQAEDDLPVGERDRELLEELERQASRGSQTLMSPAMTPGGTQAAAPLASKDHEMDRMRKEMDSMRAEIASLRAEREQWRQADVTEAHSAEGDVEM